MDGVAAKVAQEVGVLLEHDDVDAGARQQEAEHQPAGPPPTMQQRVEICSAAIRAPFPIRLM